MFRNRGPFEPGVGATLRSAALAASYLPFRVANQLGAAPEGSLRVLLYHDVGPREAEEFQSQLRWLAREWRFVSADQFAELAFEGAPIKKKSVLLTFDDGFQSNLRAARDVLTPMKIPALFFVVNDFLGLDDVEAERAFIADRIWPGLGRSRVPAHWRSMTWADTAELLERGHTIGAHTQTHARLGTIADHAMLQREIVDSGDRLSARLGCPISHFAFPFGDAASVSAAALGIAASRYEWVHSGVRGNNAARKLARLVVRDAVGLQEPAWAAGAFLEGACDRLHRAGAAEVERRWVEGLSQSGTDGGRA